MNAYLPYLPALAYLGLWLLSGFVLILLRRALAGPSPKRPSTARPEGPEIESGAPGQPLPLLGPAMSGAVLLLVLGAAGTGLVSPGAGVLPVLLLLFVLVIALIHAARRGDAPEPP